MKETLRMYPVAPGTARYVTEEVTIDGIRIPAESRVYVNIQTILLSPLSHPLIY